jgi:hypothetical protein
MLPSLAARPNELHAFLREVIILQQWTETFLHTGNIL